MFPELTTPVALVDLDVFEANIARGAARARELNVGLRPHAKTVKSPALVERVVEAGVSGLTVSTLGELESLGHLTGDILYAVPFAPGKDRRVVEAMGGGDLRLTVLVDSVEGVGAVPADPRIDVAIEIDSDGRRTGVRPESASLMAIAERVGMRLRGVATHAGAAYVESSGQVATAERDAVLLAANRLREAGYAIDMVSVGSSPTFAAVDHLRGVTEARPGVYLFGDESQVALGASDAGAVALTVLATVIGRKERAVVIDAGWSALSQDRGVPSLDGCGYGVVDGDPALVVSAATQEHGIVTSRSGGDPGLAVGDRVRIRPLHACATAEMHPWLVTVRGGAVLGRVARPRGW